MMANTRDQMRRILTDEAQRKTLLKQQRARDTRPPRGRCTRCHANMARISPRDGYTDCASCGYTNRPPAGHVRRDQRNKERPTPIPAMTDREVQLALEEP